MASCLNTAQAGDKNNSIVVGIYADHDTAIFVR